MLSAGHLFGESIDAARLGWRVRDWITTFFIPASVVVFGSLSLSTLFASSIPFIPSFLLSAVLRDVAQDLDQSLTPAAASLCRVRSVFGSRVLGFSTEIYSSFFFPSHFERSLRFLKKKSTNYLGSESLLIGHDLGSYKLFVWLTLSCCVNEDF